MYVAGQGLPALATVGESKEEPRPCASGRPGGSLAQKDDQNLPECIVVYVL